MLKFIALIVILFENVHSECERPKYLVESENDCLEITTSFMERVATTAAGVYNTAKRKLGIDVEEEPLKCSYYLCLLHNIKMVTEAGILDSDGIAEWVENHVPPEVVEAFKQHAMECFEVASNAGDVPNCQKSTDFVRCLSLFSSCRMFKFP